MAKFCPWLRWCDGPKWSVKIQFAMNDGGWTSKILVCIQTTCHNCAMMFFITTCTNVI
jgi:hypothetical protein